MTSLSEVVVPAKGTKPDKIIQVIWADDMSITFKGSSDINPNDVVQFVVMNTGKQMNNLQLLVILTFQF
jgi:uncharacterized cupredoxin-like copper-binding protein